MRTKPRVFLLGDSIRLRFQSLVTRLLGENAQIVGPDDNCRYSSIYAVINRPLVIRIGNSGHHSLE